MTMQAASMDDNEYLRTPTLEEESVPYEKLVPAPRARPRPPPLKVGMRITVRSTHSDPLDTTYVIERIRRYTLASKPTRYIIEARTERQRRHDRLETGYTSWDYTYMQACLTAGSMV